MFSIEELANDFRNLGVAAVDTVMLHASVRAVGEVVGGPDAIHLALKSALSPEGTLMMYAGCPRYYDEVGRGNLTVNQERGPTASSQRSSMISSPSRGTRAR